MALPETQSAVARPSQGRRIVLWALAILLVPAFLFSSACFYTQATELHQEASDVQSLLLSGAFSTSLSGLAIVGTIFYWSLFRLPNPSRRTVSILYFLGASPILISFSRVIIVVWAIIACFTQPDCLVL
jgi:hypothetical protein